MNSGVPACIGIIMDGNRRFAKEKGLSLLDGHKAGYEKLKEVVRWTKEAGVTCVIAYAFSTENWKRAPEEVSYLLELFKNALTREFDELKKENVRLRFIGDLSRFPKDLQELISKAEKDTAQHKNMTLALAVSYGGKAEIMNAVKKVLADKPETITETDFAKYLWTHDIPDPDLIIRTSGEMRLSNFLLWQGAYSELFFTKTKWPDFSKEELHAILKEYNGRERRGGK